MPLGSKVVTWNNFFFLSAAARPICFQIFKASFLQCNVKIVMKSSRSDARVITIWRTIGTAATPGNAVSEFNTTGIYLLNPDAIRLLFRSDPKRLTGNKYIHISGLFSTKVTLLLLTQSTTRSTSSIAWRRATSPVPGSSTIPNNICVFGQWFQMKESKSVEKLKLESWHQIKI